jgi:hypothetical protein
VWGSGLSDPGWTHLQRIAHGFGCRAYADLLSDGLRRLTDGYGVHLVFRGETFLSARPPPAPAKKRSAAKATRSPVDSARARARAVVRATTLNRTGFLRRGKIPIEAATPWRFAAALRDLSTRRRVVILEDPRPVRRSGLSF